MPDFIKLYKIKMAKEAIDLTCVAMVNILKYVPGVQGVDEAVSITPRHLTFFPDRLKTKGMCDEAVRVDPWSLGNVTDHFKTQEMCKRVVEENPRVVNMFQTNLKPKKCMRRQ